MELNKRYTVESTVDSYVYDNNIYLNHLHITKSNYTQGKITNNDTEWNMIQCKGN